MVDGTYYINPLTDEIINYGEKWQYGYFVGTQTAFSVGPEWEYDLEDNVRDTSYATGSAMVGVWTSDTGTTYFDAVQHVSDRNSAKELAIKYNQEYVFDAFLQKSVKVDEL
jgi:hypothetical protein